MVRNLSSAAGSNLYLESTYLYTTGFWDAVGPMLIGTAMPAHIVTPSITSRGLLNMTALSVVGAQAHAIRHVT